VYEIRVKEIIMNAGTGLNENLMGMSPFGCKADISSNTAKAIGKAVVNQLVKSGANIATDALIRNDVNESVQRELQNTRQNADVGILNLKRALKCKKLSRGIRTFRV